MELAEIFLIVSILMFFFDFIQLYTTKPHEERKLEHGFYATTLAFGLVFISYIMLVQAFLKDDFSLKEVYSSSSSSLPAASKIFATWSAAGGSLLFLTLLITSVYFVYRFRANEKRSQFHISASMMLNVILIFFLILTFMKNPFERWPIALVEGRGLNPQLQSSWMSIHPPIVFSAYVFILLAFSLTLAGMRTGERAEERILVLSLQAAWLLLTLGIVLGGLWAYEVLGWGGYWSWDPIETGSLMTWLALSSYFHLGALQKTQSYLKEFTVLLTFAALILLSALTRGGFRTSVHAYALSPAGPFLLLFLVGMTLYFFYLKRNIKEPLFALEVKKSSLFSVSLGAGYGSLIFIFLICSFGVIAPIVGRIFLTDPPIPSGEFYNVWNFPFVLGFVAALIGCSLRDKRYWKLFGVLVGGALAIGVIFIQLQVPTFNLLANLGIPLLMVGLIVEVYMIARGLVSKNKSVRQLGRSILHIGITITLIGVFISSAAQQVSVIEDARPNSSIDTLGFRIEFQDFTVYAGSGSVYFPTLETVVPESSALSMHVEIERGVTRYEGMLWSRLFTNYGLVSTPLIITTESGDIYMHMGFTESMYNSLLLALMGEEVQPEDLILTVETMPLVYLVWIGVALMCMGIGIPLVKELFT